MPRTAPAALITGSGKRRIGNTVARLLAAKGYRVALNYHSSEQEAKESVAEITAAGGVAAALQADVTREEQVERLCEETLRQFGRLDLLVTCAARWTAASLERTDAAMALQELNVNAVGTFLCAKYAGMAMCRQAEGGCIVTMSDWAVDRPYSGYSAYFMSKGAVTALTKALAVELAERNPKVRVNCIAPGPAMVPESVGVDELRAIEQATLVRSLGSPEHIAQAVLFVAENTFVSGTCIVVDGGRTLA